MTCTSSQTHMVDAREIQAHLAPHLPALGEEGRAYHMVRAAAELMRYTKCTDAVFYLDGQADVDTYRIQTRDGLMPCAIRHVTAGDCALAPRQEDYSGRSCHGDYTYWYEPPFDLFISPAPSCDEPNWIEVRAHATLSRNACAVPEQVAELYIDNLIDGALSNAYLLEDTDFYDSRKAGIHTSKWKKALNQIRRDATARFSTGPKYMKGVPWL